MEEIAKELGVREELLDELRLHAGLPEKQPGVYELEVVREWRKSRCDGGEGGPRYLEELLRFRKPSAV